jgi:hypothetical protein
MHKSGHWLPTKARKWRGDSFMASGAAEFALFTTETKIGLASSTLRAASLECCGNDKKLR